MGELLFFSVGITSRQSPPFRTLRQRNQDLLDRGNHTGDDDGSGW